MKRFIVLVLVLASTAFALQAQKVGYINTEEIMQKMPEYQEAQAAIDEISALWQTELEKKYAKIEQMYQEYAAQEVLYTEEVKQQKQDAIFQLERAAKEYREEKFGYNGNLFSFQENKLKPLQEKILAALKVVIARRKYSLVFDKAGSATWLYTDPAYDLGEEVLEELGLGEEEKRDR
ncbi:MAG: OmpH family outer membrane protein [Bacteroidia bacterium]